MASLLETAMKSQMASRSERMRTSEAISEDKIKDIVSEYVQDAMEVASPKQDDESLRKMITSCIQEAMAAQTQQPSATAQSTATEQDIQAAVNKAVKEALAGIQISGGDGKTVVAAPADTTHIQEQVDKIFAEMTRQFEKQNEVINSVSAASEENKKFMTDIQTRMDQQTEKNAELVAHVQEKDQALMTIDYVAMRDNIADFKAALEENNQTMDQLRKQLNRERNNNDRTVTELYRSMKSSEEQIEDLHSSYEEFTTVITSHKSIMSLLIWLDIVIIAALIVFNIINLF